MVLTLNPTLHVVARNILWTSLFFNHLAYVTFLPPGHLAHSSSRHLASFYSVFSTVCRSEHSPPTTWAVQGMTLGWPVQTRAHPFRDVAGQCSAIQHHRAGKGIPMAT